MASSHRFVAPAVWVPVALLGVATALGFAPSQVGQNPQDGRAFLRGMIVSCPRDGRIWGSPAMEEALAELVEIGVQWVSIHPYAWVRRDGTIRSQPASHTGYLDRAVTLARQADVELYWKPHLGYWGSFAWRGEIDFGNDETAWQRFFSGYRRFIVDQAQFAEAAGVPLFSVGLEYEKTTGREAEWRRIISEIRRVYTGKITYAANWDRLHLVPFWDAVDLIGVQAYFPLSQEPYPDAEAINRGWDGPVEELRRLSKRYGKPVLLSEIGYDVSPEAAVKPWQALTEDTAPNRALQRRLMEVALDRLESETFIHGMFWWKWIPGSRYRGDFSMRRPEARTVLGQAWGSRGKPASRSSSAH